MSSLHLCKSSLITAAALVYLLGTATAGAQGTERGAADMPKAHTSAASGAPNGAASMHQIMMTGMEDMNSMQPTGDADKDFASMMKMHHQQAVDMAKVELAQGKSPALKAMARKIMADQQKEIAQLDKWLASGK